MFIVSISRLVTVAVYFIKSYQLAESIEDYSTAKPGDKVFKAIFTRVL